MAQEENLQRFIQAHEQTYDTALKEIRGGRKYSHWMWYIFPQLKGLGRSSTSEYYGISDLEEARSFLHHPYLGGHLREICQALLELETNQAEEIFGWPDDKKLKSSMILFALAEEGEPVFRQVLEKFFLGREDGYTRKLLGLPKSMETESKK